MKKYIDMLDELLYYETMPEFNKKLIIELIEKLTLDNSKYIVTHNEPASPKCEHR